MENHKARERRKTIKQGKPYRRLTGWERYVLEAEFQAVPYRRLTGWELHLIPRLRRYLLLRRKVNTLKPVFD